MSRFRTAVGSCLLAAALAAAPPALAAKIKMVFPGPATTLSLPYFVAQKKGWLGDLEVEEIYVTGDANAMRVLISGNADIGTIGMVNVFSSIQAGANVRAIHSWQPIGDYSLVIVKGKGSTYADLAGKTFASSGPGNLPDQIPRLIMRKHNVDENSARFIQIGGHSARLQAVVGGRAEATLVNTVTALKGIQEGKVTLVTKVSQEFPGLGYVWNVVRADSLNDPKMAPMFQTLTDIGIRGTRFIIENPDEAAEILRGRLTEFDLDYLKAVVRDLNGERLWGVNGGLEPEVEEFTAKLNTELGNLSKPVPPGDVLDNRFVDVALKKLGRYPSK